MKKVRIMAAVAALFTCIFVFMYLRSLNSSSKSEDTIDVVVAVKNIISQTTITAEMVTTKSIPNSDVIPNTVKKVEDVIGKIARADIFEGETILTGKFYDTNSSSAGLAYTLPKGKRAITMMVDEKSGVSGLIRPQNFVDIMTIMDYEDKAKPDSVKTILKKIKVVAVGQVTHEAADAEAKTYQTVTLAVTPQEALKLALCDYGETEPKIICQLLLRPQGDEDVSDASVITVNNIIQ